MNHSEQRKIRVNNLRWAIEQMIADCAMAGGRISEEDVIDVLERLTAEWKSKRIDAVKRN